MDSLSPNVTHMPLSCHEVTALPLRLPLVTAAGLQAAGIPLQALGTLDGNMQVLSSFLYSFSFCKENLATKFRRNSWRIFDSSQPSIGQICAQVHIASPTSQPFTRSILKSTMASQPPGSFGFLRSSLFFFILQRPPCSFFFFLLLSSFFLLLLLSSFKIKM